MTFFSLLWNRRTLTIVNSSKGIMRRLNQIIVAILFVGVLSLVVASPVLAATQTPENVTATEIPTDKIRVVGIVHVKNEKVKDLFNYVSNLEHDTQWYPGVLSSELTVGKGEVDSQYHQLVNLGTGKVDITASISGYRTNHYLKFSSNSVLGNITEYYLLPGEQQSSYLMIDSLVTKAPGVTQQSMGSYIKLALQNLLKTLDKEGEVSIVE
jgi:hypothetical protein